MECIPGWVTTSLGARLVCTLGKFTHEKPSTYSLLQSCLCSSWTGLLLSRLVTPSTMSLGPIYTTGWREKTWMEVCCQRNQCDNKASSRALDLIQVFFFSFPLRLLLRVLKSHIILTCLRTLGDAYWDQYASNYVHIWSWPKWWSIWTALNIRFVFFCIFFLYFFFPSLSRVLVPAVQVQLWL